jgi:acyl-coenzyme A synthetase/AMP-(fatty) acid ligase
MNDAIELTAEGRFRLLGRLGDMVSVAGKRTNLAALNAILSETDEILDGVVLRHTSDDGDIIAVVAVLDRDSGITEAQAKTAIRREFREHVDPIFLPKRIRFTDALPRSSTGKITEAERKSLMQLVGIDD